MGRGVSLAMSTKVPASIISCSIASAAACKVARSRAETSICTGREAPGPAEAASTWMPRPGRLAVRARISSMISPERRRVCQSVNSTWICPITSEDRLPRTRSSTEPMVRE